MKYSILSPQIKYEAEARTTVQQQIHTLSAICPENATEKHSREAEK